MLERKEDFYIVKPFHKMQGGGAPAILLTASWQQHQTGQGLSSLAADNRQMGNTVPQHLFVDKEQEDGNYNDDDIWGLRVGAGILRNNLKRTKQNQGKRRFQLKPAAIEV